jgi:hypothetical protein
VAVPACPEAVLFHGLPVVVDQVQHVHSKIGRNYLIIFLRRFFYRKSNLIHHLHWFIDFKGAASEK